MKSMQPAVGLRFRGVAKNECEVAGDKEDRETNLYVRTSSSSLSLIFCIPRQTLLRCSGWVIPNMSCRSLSFARNSMSESRGGRGRTFCF